MLQNVAASTMAIAGFSMMVWSLLKLSGLLVPIFQSVAVLAEIY